jgi:hypothetical protein
LELHNSQTYRQLLTTRCQLRIQLLENENKRASGKKPAVAAAADSAEALQQVVLRCCSNV